MSEERISTNSDQKRSHLTRWHFVTNNVIHLSFLLVSLGLLKQSIRLIYISPTPTLQTQALTPGHIIFALGYLSGLFGLLFFYLSTTNILKKYKGDVR